MDKIAKHETATGKHTPGPWARPYYDNNPGDTGWWIHNGKVGPGEYAVAVTFAGNPRSESDARLIAAAPELLEALSGALRMLEAVWDYDGDVFGRLHNDAVDAEAAARAAISKAIGA